ncbi:MAG: hypothetical protein QM743_14450 [Chitinophagaceae bacterium]
MKKLLPLILFQAVLAVVAGTLVAKMSFIARSAIGIFRHHYRFYAFMKVWWQTALLMFVIWMLLLALQSYWNNSMVRSRSAVRHIICIVLALIGLYFTYADFRSDIAHRWAGERLHLGFYLFWVGWIVQSVFLLTRPAVFTKDADKTDASAL